MLTIDDYCDTAKQRCRFRSDRVLSKALNVNNSSVSQWRTKRTWPADETMLRLADLAGVDPEQALLDLNAWRAASSTVRSVYERIASRIAVAIAVIFVFVGVVFGTAGPAEASGTVGSVETSFILWKIRLHNWLRRTFGGSAVRHA